MNTSKPPLPPMVPAQPVGAGGPRRHKLPTIEELFSVWPVFAIIVAVVVILGGILEAVAPSGYRPEYFGHRFQSENATAATANAVEWIADELPTRHGVSWVLVGLLVLVVVELDGIRRAIGPRKSLPDG